MKHINNYLKFFTSIKEQAQVKPEDRGIKKDNKDQNLDISPAPAAKVEVPEWFEKGFFTEDKAKSGASKKMAISADKLNEYWTIITKYAKHKKETFDSVKSIQKHLWDMMTTAKCDNKEGETTTLMDVVNTYRNGIGLGKISKPKFIDDKYGNQTHKILMSAICISGVNLSDEQNKIVDKNKIPGVEPPKIVPDKKESNQVISPDQIIKNFEETGKTGLSPEELEKRAQTILQTSLTPDNSDTKDKIKGAKNLEAAKIGHRIKLKDKGSDKLEKHELAILDNFFGDHGYVRIKAADKSYGIKYVWVKKLNQREETPKQAPAEKVAPTNEPNVANLIDMDDIKGKGL